MTVTATPTTWGDALERFDAYLTIRGRSDNTRLAYNSDLRQLRDWLEAAGYELPDLSDAEECEPAVAAYLNASEHAPKTQQRRLGTYRCFWKFLDRTYAFLDDYHGPTPARPDPHPLPGGMADVLTLIAHAWQPHHAALVALCGLCGLRVGEAVTVRPEDYDRVEETLYVMGKGARARVVPVNAIAQAFIENAIREGGDRIVPLANRSAREAITEIGRRCGIEVKSHDLRATFATAAYEKSKDIRAVQELLGHSTSAQTEVYIRVAMKAMRAAAEVV